MRLLITTQAVDLDDPVLAFFHQWIAESASQVEHVEVICLKEGRHDLPNNVSVHSLEKEKGESNLKYIRLFFKYAWGLRGRYDAVFVHMNPEYLVLGGLMWRLLRKPTTLWYIHPRSSWRLFIARIFVNHIVSATDKSFPLHSSKLIAIGHGIDTDLFSPGEELPPGASLRVMQAARIAPVKRIETVIAAMSELVGKKNIPALFDYYGTELPRDRQYAEAIRMLVPAAMPPDVWHWRGNATQVQIRDAYRTHDVHVNATDSGSFDKAVFESMACGTITVVSNTALASTVPAELIFKEGDSESLADTLQRIAEMSVTERAFMSMRLRKIAEEKYSLRALITRVVAVLAS